MDSPYYRSKKKYHMLCYFFFITLYIVLFWSAPKSRVKPPSASLWCVSGRGGHCTRPAMPVDWRAYKRANLPAWLAQAFHTLNPWLNDAVTTAD